MTPEERKRARNKLEEWAQSRHHHDAVEIAEDWVSAHASKTLDALDERDALLRACVDAYEDCWKSDYDTGRNKPPALIAKIRAVLGEP